MSKEREGDGMRGPCWVLRSLCRRKDALGIGDIPEGTFPSLVIVVVGYTHTHTPFLTKKKKLKARN